MDGQVTDRSQSDWATAHAKKVLRAALRGLAYGKCAFCESVLEVTAYLEIEHYVAKTVTPALAFEWSNLLPACRLCNNAKGEQDHQGMLLKPDAEDPEPYFWIHPDTGKLEPHPKLDEAQSRRANETIRLCDLQRPAFCTKRVEMLMRVLRWLSSAKPAGPEWEELSEPQPGVQIRPAPRPRNPRPKRARAIRPRALHRRIRPQLNEC